MVQTLNFILEISLMQFVRHCIRLQIFKVWQTQKDHLYNSALADGAQAQCRLHSTTVGHTEKLTRTFHFVCCVFAIDFGSSLIRSICRYSAFPTFYYSFLIVFHLLLQFGP